MTVNYASRTVSVPRGDGASHFGTATTFSTGGNSPRSIALADVNDVSEPGRLQDTFQIEISNNLTVGGVLSAGNVSINR